MKIIKSPETKNTLKNRFIAAREKAFLIFFKDSPVDTGLLRRSIKLIEVNSNEFWIYNDLHYMQYTEEEWTGRKSTNPNQGWFNRAVNKAVEYIISEMSEGSE